ncbi:MAG: hypothetical protein OEM02_02240 [Desulfobulbaceae bacterium]|nr:hypothetical protein [Desulfobulbaceae bacterium]
MSDQKALCREALSAAVVGFRLGMEGQASENLAKFVDCFLPLLQEAKQLNVDEVNHLFGEVLAAQSRKDFLRVADLLEYEISRLLAD